MTTERNVGANIKIVSREGGGGVSAVLKPKKGKGGSWKVIVRFCRRMRKDQHGAAGVWRRGEKESVT